ncbi:SseB family protein [Spirillospora sp. NPDC052269]
MKQGVATVADGWQPTSELERRLGDAVRNGDQEGYFRLLAESELVVPVPPEMTDDVLAGRRQPTWPTQDEDDRTFVLVYTSPTAMRACLGPSYRHYIRAPFTVLAETWPDNNWWLAVDVPSHTVRDVSLPIEGRLPAWFILRLAQGDQRPPLAGHHQPDPSALSGPAAPPPQAAPSAPAQDGAHGEPIGAQPPAAPTPATPPGAPMPAVPPAAAAEYQPPVEAGAEQASAAPVPEGDVSVARERDADAGDSQQASPPALDDPRATIRDLSVYTGHEAPEGEAEPPLPPGIADMPPVPEPPGPKEASPAATSVDPIPVIAPRQEPDEPWEELQGQHRDLPRTEPRPEFQPANDVERSLLRAATDNDHDLFLQTLADAEVLLPVGPDADFTLRPGRAEFQWRTREADGATLVQVFSSPERLAEAAATAGTDSIRVPFPLILRYWPEHANALAINPGSPAGGTILAEQLPGLATWADQRSARRMSEDFEAQNEVEQRLFDAAVRRDTDAFFKVLLGAQVLIPAEPDTPWGITPDDAEFPWRPARVHGRVAIQLFTSLRWMNEAVGSSRFVMPTFLEVVAAWPDAEWTLVLNPGTPVDAAIPGEQVRALSGPTEPSTDMAAAAGASGPADGGARPDTLAPANANANGHADVSGPLDAPGSEVPAHVDAPERASEGANAPEGAGVPEHMDAPGYVEASAGADIAGLAGANGHVEALATPDAPGNADAADASGHVEAADTSGQADGANTPGLAEANGRVETAGPDASSMTNTAGSADESGPVQAPAGTDASGQADTPGPAGANGHADTTGADPSGYADTAGRSEAVGGTTANGHGGVGAAEADGHGDAEASTGRPAGSDAPFEPGNRIDQELYEAALGGDSDAFLRVLLAANVLVPIPQDAPLQVTPTQQEFRWDAALRGSAAVQVFTSLVRLREVLPESRFVYADFRELIAAWPHEDWAMLLNPGTRIGASLRGDQVRALSEWAIRVGLVQPPEPAPTGPATTDASTPSGFGTDAEALTHGGPHAETPDTAPSEPHANPQSAFTAGTPDGSGVDAHGGAGLPIQGAPQTAMPDGLGTDAQGMPHADAPRTMAGVSTPDALSTGAPDWADANTEAQSPFGAPGVPAPDARGGTGLPVQNAPHTDASDAFGADTRGADARGADARGAAGANTQNAPNADASSAASAPAPGDLGANAQGWADAGTGVQSAFGAGMPGGLGEEAHGAAEAPTHGGPHAGAPDAASSGFDAEASGAAGDLASGGLGADAAGWADAGTDAQSAFDAGAQGVASEEARGTDEPTTHGGPHAGAPEAAPSGFGADAHGAGGMNAQSSPYADASGAAGASAPGGLGADGPGWADAGTDVQSAFGVGARGGLGEEAHGAAEAPTHGGPHAGTPGTAPGGLGADAHGAGGVNAQGAPYTDASGVAGDLGPGGLGADGAGWGDAGADVQGAFGVGARGGVGEEALGAGEVSAHGGPHAGAPGVSDAVSGGFGAGESGVDAQGVARPDASGVAGAAVSGGLGAGADAQGAAYTDASGVVSGAGGFGTDALGWADAGAEAQSAFGADVDAAGPGGGVPGMPGGARAGGPGEVGSFDGVAAFGVSAERRRAGEPDGEFGAEPTIMQKVVPHAHVAWYLEQGYDRVGGFVHPTADVAELQTPGQLYETLGLLYEDAPFSVADESVHVIRWPAYCPDLYRVPFGGRTEEEVASWGEAGWVLERPPFTGAGFAPGSAGSIREYKVDSVRLPFGAEMYVLGRDGSERFVAMYDPDRLAWLRPEGATPAGRTEVAR